MILLSCSRTFNLSSDSTLCCSCELSCCLHISHVLTLVFFRAWCLQGSLTAEEQAALAVLSPVLQEIDDSYSWFAELLVRCGYCTLQELATQTRRL